MHMPGSIGRVRAVNLLFQWKKHNDEYSQRQYQRSNGRAPFTTVHSQLLFEWVLLTEADR